MRRYRFNWFVIFFFIAVIVSIFLFRQYKETKNLIGIVETRSHLLSAQEPGIIREMFISIGDQVKKGQKLALVEISDFEMGQNLLTNLQLENEVFELKDRLSLLESQNTELASLNAELERLQDAENAGLGHAQDFMELSIRRDALSSYMKEQISDLRLKHQKLIKAKNTRQALDEIEDNANITLMETMNESQPGHQIKFRSLISPCDGYVVDLFARPGDVIDQFLPVFSIEESDPRCLTIYVPATSHSIPEIGKQVKIYSMRSKQFNTTGVISFIHPGFSMAPERLWPDGQILWAWRVLVDLDANHHLLPGEMVFTSITNHRIQTSEKNEYDSNTNDVAENTDNIHETVVPTLVDMQVEPELWQKTRFEPSGIAWLDDIQKYLIVSDDTSIKDTDTDHAPWVFFMDKQGHVDRIPVELHGIESVNDLEAVAPIKDDLLYLVSSQNISKQGKRPKTREMIYKVRRSAHVLEVEDQVAFLSLISNSYSSETCSALGLDKYAEDGRPILNIEGAVYHEDALYLGLKQPLLGNKAIIWKLTDPESMFKNKKILPGQLSLYGTVQLILFHEKSAAISDLTFDSHGQLWALSTISNVDNEDQMGSLHRIEMSNNQLKSQCLYRFPGLKPEGLCFDNMGYLTIVIDKDNQTPAFCHIAPEAL